MKKVLVSGGQGKFAQALLSTTNFDYKFVLASKNELDVSNADQLEKILDKEKPEIFIHAGALTRPMKKHVERPDVSISSNIVGTANVVLSCMKRGIKVVYISTDYVYPGVKGNYKESDPVLPINEYAWSKLGGECSVVLYKNSLILRMAMTEVPFPHPRAFIDVTKNPISQYDAAEICIKLLDCTGIINVGGETCVIYDFAKKYNDKVGKAERKEVNDTTVPSDSSMDLSKMKEALK